MTDYSQVIDFSGIENGLVPDNVRVVECSNNNSRFFAPVRKIYELTNVPGLYFIPNPFTGDQQKLWINKCIKEYTIGNPTNISNLTKSPPWDSWEIEKMAELRWTAVGYHYQWTERIYQEEHKGPFPDELRELVSDLAGLVHHSIYAEAAIINYYPHLKCQMGAHVDDAEDDMSKPIVSISFGNSIVFLIGGRTRDIIPTPIFIRSGDVVIMSGESRYCYHSVPRMIEHSLPEYLLDDNDESWKDCKDYIRNARININCRQVRVLSK